MESLGVCGREAGDVETETGDAQVGRRPHVVAVVVVSLWDGVSGA